MKHRFVAATSQSMDRLLAINHGCSINATAMILVLMAWLVCSTVAVTKMVCWRDIHQGFGYAMSVVVWYCVACSHLARVLALLLPA